MRISNSKASTYRRCPRRFRFKYIEGLNPKQKAVQLERGSWIHELLQTYYDGEDWKATHKRLTKKFYRLFEEEREDLGELPTECLRIFRSYLRNYPDDFQRFVVVDTELDEIVTLPNGLEFQMIVDLIVEDLTTHKLWLWDHKTRGNFVDTESMLLDPQLTNYYAGAQLLGYQNLAGVCYNEICTKPPTVPEQLKTGGLTKRKNIATDVFTYYSEIKRLGLNPQSYRDILQHIAVTSKDKFFYRTWLPKDPPMLKIMMKELVQTADQITADTKRDRFPRTFIPKQCKWDCSYKNLCITELHGGDYAPMVKMEFETREQRKKREARERRKERMEAKRG